MLLSQLEGCYRLCTAIGPFWFSTEHHCPALLTLFTLSTGKILFQLLTFFLIVESGIFHFCTRTKHSFMIPYITRQSKCEFLSKSIMACWLQLLPDSSAFESYSHSMIRFYETLSSCFKGLLLKEENKNYCIPQDLLFSMSANHIPREVSSIGDCTIFTRITFKNAP